MHPLHTKNIRGDTYRNGRWICFDFETTNKEHGNPLLPENRVVMVAWQEGRGSKCGPVHYHYGTLAEAHRFWEALERADFLIAQNGKFEAHWLWNAGYDPTDRLWYDTMLAEWVLLGNNPRKKLLNLDALAERYGETKKDEGVAALIEGGVCPSEIPQEKLIARCRRDVRTTAGIYMKQMQRLEKRKLLGCVVVRCLTMAVLCAIERNGLTLDKQKVIQTYNQYRDEYFELKRAFDKFSGGVNFNSPQQLAHFLYGGGLVEEVENVQVGTYKNGKPKFKKQVRWVPNTAPSLKFKELKHASGRPKRNAACKAYPDGLPKTDSDTLEALKDTARTKRQREFFERVERLNEVSSALSKNLEFFYGVVQERNCRFFAEIRQGTTATHRLSGRGRPQKFTMFPKPKSMQTQNSPRAFKSLYCSAHEDYYHTNADAAQLEFRVAAFLGQDRIAMANIRDPDFDAHMQTCTVMNDPDYSGDINQELYLELLGIRRDKKHSRNKEIDTWRTEAKPDTFKPLYGGEKGTPRQERYYKWFQQRYSDFYEWSMQNLGMVESGDGKGHLTLPTGMTFFWDFYFKQDTAYDAYKHRPIKPSVFNYPVQYLATGEIVLIALIHLYYRVRKAQLRVNFTNTVHDSVTADVHKEDIHAYRELVVQAFTKDVYAFLDKIYGIKFNVPLGCELTWVSLTGESGSFAADVDPLQEAA